MFENRSQIVFRTDIFRKYTLGAPAQNCQNNWKLISHANISSKGLNKGGLHLNREGYELLQKNFVNFMRSNCSMNVDYPLVSQMLPELVDNDVHSGSSGSSSMPNFYQLNVVSKWPVNINSLVKHFDELRVSVLLSFHLIFWQLMKPNLTNP